MVNNRGKCTVIGPISSNGDYGI